MSVALLSSATSVNLPNLPRRFIWSSVAPGQQLDHLLEGFGAAELHAILYTTLPGASSCPSDGCYSVGELTAACGPGVRAALSASCTEDAATRLSDPPRAEPRRWLRGGAVPLEYPPLVAQDDGTKVSAHLILELETQITAGAAQTRGKLRLSYIDRHDHERTEDYALEALP